MRRIAKHVVTDSERWRVALLAEYGFFASTIARRLWGKGDPRYTPSSTEISRIYRIAKSEGIKLRDWRKGENESARSVLSSICRAKLDSSPKLRVVA